MNNFILAVILLFIIALIWGGSTMNPTIASVEDNSAARYRDWGTLRYWFRAVEKYAPWVRKVFFVTCGQKPEWLDLSYEKVVFIQHKDFIPEEYLPTFNSRTIEMNLWRINGLSEHFIYFNDDVFLNRPVTPDNFYKNGHPKLCSVAIPFHFHIPNSGNVWKRPLLNDIGISNFFKVSTEFSKEFLDIFKLLNSSKLLYALTVNINCSRI